MDSQHEHEAIEEAVAFLPTIREKYKYLGLYQLERETYMNVEKICNLALEKTSEILD